MASPLKGGRAVVVGASSGVGAAVASALADAGMKIHAAARRRDAINVASGGCMASHELDITNRSAVSRFAGEISAGGALHALVITAGVNVPERRFEQLSGADWDQLLATNLTGSFDVLRAFLDPLRESRGVAILIGSVSGTWPDSSGAGYQAAKAGLLAMARAAALEEHVHGVRITTMLPGMIDTPLLDRRPVPPSRRMREQMLVAEDVAAACLFILSLPPRAYIPELTILPTALQALGATDVAAVD